MTHRLDTPRDVQPLHLPPASAWKDPERWLGDINSRNQPRKKLDVPVDDRGFVKPDETIEMVKELFVSSYEWVRDPTNPETRLDDHHFYFDEEDYKAIHHNGSTIPMRFREQAPNIGTMQRNLHNAIHHTTNKPAIPEIDAMDEYNIRYLIAKQAFSNLHEAATNTLQAQHFRWARRQDIKRNPWRLGERDEDLVGEQYNESQFKRHFSAYLDALEKFQKIDNKDIIVPGKKIKLERATPHQILRIGKIVARQAVNYQTPADPLAA